MFYQFADHNQIGEKWATINVKPTTVFVCAYFMLQLSEEAHRPHISRIAKKIFHPLWVENLNIKWMRKQMHVSWMLMVMCNIKTRRKLFRRHSYCINIKKHEKGIPSTRARKKKEGEWKKLLFLGFNHKKGFGCEESRFLFFIFTSVSFRWK